VNNIKVVSKEDGAYVQFGNLDGLKPERKQIIDVVDSYGVKEIDFPALSVALAQDDLSNKEFRISKNNTIFQEAESSIIDVSSDGMEAFIIFKAPVNDGPRMSEADIIAAIEAAGIVEYNSDTVNTLSKHRAHDRRYAIAKGIAPANGVDGYLQYHFNNENLRPKPKILEDGSVDFRQLGLLRLTERGDVLVTSVPAREGTNGKNVRGEDVPYVEGRRPQPIPKGKNTYLSEDELHLIADVSGQIIIQNGRIDINPSLEIRGHVDNSTGNIDFNGQVIIQGNVLTGFEVKAQGNIEIYGVCEGATLITDSDIVIGRGAQGMERAVLQAAGNITAKFLEGCNVTAKGNVYADSILNSTVNSGGEVILEGRRGLLTGGKLVAASKLVAKTIGSPMGTATVIEVGNKPEAINSMKDMMVEYEKTRKEFEKVNQAVTLLSSQQKKGQLNDERKQLLMKMLNAKLTYREKLNNLQVQIEEANLSVTSNDGTVSASNMIQPGVKVTIGNAQLNVRDRIQHCTLRNNGEKISIGSFAG
jgi:uncharacterized protein (DUF342 family)